MQNKWGASRSNPAAQLANSSAASSSSSSSSISMDDDDTRVVLHSSRGVQVFDAENPEPKRIRAPKPSVPDWRHLDFIEQLAQWAYDAQEGNAEEWRMNNNDVDFCEKHEELVEMLKFHEPRMYNPECGKCLKSQKNNDASGVPLTAFFAKQHMGISTLEEAEANWQNLRKEKERIQKEHAAALAKKLMSVETAEKAERTCSFLERSAFLWYYYLAWVDTQYRIAAIRENAAAPGSSSKFTMLPSGMPDALVKFNSNCKVRGTKTAAGRVGQLSNNLRPCNIHAGASGHMIHGYNKDRYLECGVCVKKRDVSLTQKMMDSQAFSSTHPAVEFAEPKKIVTATKSRFRVPPAAAAARLTAPVARMESMSLQDEAQMN